MNDDGDRRDGRQVPHVCTESGLSLHKLYRLTCLPSATKDSNKDSEFLAAVQLCARPPTSSNG